MESEAGYFPSGTDMEITGSFGVQPFSETAIYRSDLSGLQARGKQPSTPTPSSRDRPAGETYPDDGRTTRLPITRKDGGTGQWGHHRDRHDEPKTDGSEGGIAWWRRKQ